MGQERRRIIITSVLERAVSRERLFTHLKDAGLRGDEWQTNE